MNHNKLTITFIMGTLSMATGCTTSEPGFADLADEVAPDGKADGSCGDGTCAKLCAVPVTAPVSCQPLSRLEQAVFNELATVWRVQPTYICAYHGAAGATCGDFEIPANNGVYCHLDGGVLFDKTFLTAQATEHGDFAAVTILAHEWGHLMQGVAGVFGKLPVKQQELQADCLAGVFTAVEEQRGTLDPEDIDEGSSLICKAGDAPGSIPEFAHGTCAERTQAFEHGIARGREYFAAVCDADPFDAAFRICG